MVLATMIDTASFHSTKSVISDLDYIKDICSKYDIDYDVLYNEGLVLSDISDLDKAKLNGLKEYFCDGMKLESSFLHIDSFDKRKDIILEIIELLNSIVDDSTVNIGILHKVFELLNSEKAELLVSGQEKAEEIINNTDTEE